MADKPLISLAASEAEQKRRFDDLERPRPNGIACPKCGKEMLDHLTEWASVGGYARVKASCGCGFETYRIK